MENKLAGKIIIFDGDSICHATSETTERERGWAYRIGEENQMEWYNQGISGATVTAEMYSKVTGNARHWVSRNIDNIKKEHPYLDYLILEGGTNDADLLAEFPEKMGVVDPSDFDGPFDDTTFCGACESLFFKAISYYPQAKIGYIIAPKMCDSTIEIFHNRRRYFEIIISICKKWGIPYIDLWEGCPINPRLKVYYDEELSGEENAACGKAYLDGQHLSKVGYDMVSPLIENWIRTI